MHRLRPCRPDDLGYAEKMQLRPLLRVLIPVLCAAVVAGEEPAATPTPAPAPAPADAAGLAFFEEKIRPVLAEKCYECHSAAKKVKAKLHLDSREGVLAGGETGPAIVAGDPDKSLLIKAISWHDEDLKMPPKVQLPATVVANFTAWVKRGAPDPRTGGATSKTIDLAKAREHWSYRPLAKPTAPAVKNQAWPRGDIDRFILAQLEQAKLSPAAPAERRVLIRRLHAVLTGLPPAPDEVDAFVADASPDATAKLVDRLLASQGFGERWARHWLDVARFAESHGYEQDYDRPFAYHYRDFVIKAFNDDLPYTTFVSWQLAGDELAGDDTEALKATGFIAAGVWPTQITKNEVEKSRYDALDDMVGTTFTAMLGTTVACARCHDHKFDPITQRDYYRLLATFTTTIRSEVERDVTSAGFDAKLTAFASEHAPFDQALRSYEQDELPKRFAAAEAALDPATARWATLVPSESKSEGGATITAQDDGSLLITGKNPDHETLTFTLETGLTGMTGLRIEALSHPSLAKGGPGRADNGNFCLSDLTVTAAPSAGGDKIAVTLKDPRSTFDQQGLGVALAIDSDGTSGWAVDPQFGKDHAAAFAFAAPIGFPGGTRLTITMRFANNLRHGMGRPRFALSTGTVELDGTALTPVVAAALRVPAAERTPDQRTALISWYRIQDPDWRRLRAAADEHLKKQPKRDVVKVLIGTEGLPAVRLHTQGGDFLEQTHFLRRGDPDQKQDVVSQGFWPVLSDGADSRWLLTPPAGARTSYRRRALAAWITDVDHGAGRVLARVMVNRVWQHLFGRGLSATPSDVGLRGDVPAHAQLIDRLASDFIAGGWKIKPLIRAIALSATFAQSSVGTPAAFAVDPENRLWSHFRRQRMEAEAVRDSLLALGGLLDPRMYGPGTLDEASPRRSIYFTIKRSALIPFLTAFDFPEPLQGVADRPATTVAPQALALLNNPQARAWAAGFASRVASASDDGALVTLAWRLALSRAPGADELKEATAFIVRQTAARGGDRRAALTDFCQVLMCRNEVIYVP